MRKRGELFGWLALLLALAGGGAYALGGTQALINLAVGFVCALLVMGASAFGYWQMVEGAKTSPSAHSEQTEPGEGYGDWYGLWEEQTPPPDDVKTLLNEQKARLKEQKPSLKARLASAKPALSLYRLGAYGVLIYGVYALIGAQIFKPVAYLAGATTALGGVALWLYVRGKVRP